MKRLLRLFAAAVSFACLLLIVAAAGVFALFGTQTGRDLVENETRAALGRLFGPSYDVALGQQTFDIRDDGTLAVSWTGVRLQRRDQPERRSEVGRVTIALRLMPLVGGNLEFGRLEVNGARIDLAAFGEPTRRTRTPADVPRPAPATPQPDVADVRSVIARSADSAIRTLERQLRTLQAYHFDTVVFEDILVEGLPDRFNRISDVEVKSAELRRRFDGSLALATQLRVGPLPLSLNGSARFDEEDARLRSLDLRSGRTELATILPPAPLAAVDDERPFGSSSEVGVELRIDRDPVRDTPVMTVGLRAGPGDLQLGLNRTRVETVELQLEYREGEDRLRLLPSTLRFRDMDTVIAGDLEPEERDGAIDPERFRFALEPTMVRSRVGLPEGSTEPLEAKLTLNGRIDLASRIFALERVEVLTGGGRLGGSAIYRGASESALTSLRLVASDLPASAVKAFWPFNISGRARLWVLNHVGDIGTVPQGAIGMDVRRDRLGTAFRPGGNPSDREMRIDLRLNGIETATVGEMPRLEAVDGRVETRGSTTRVIVDEARAQGVAELEFGRSVVTMGRLEGGDPRDMALGLEVEARGGLREGLEIADRAPIRALRSVEIDPAKASGRVEASITAQLALGKSIRPADQVRGWSVEGTVADASLGQPIAGRKVENVDGPVRLEPGLLSGTLTADVEGIPAKVSVALPFGAKPVGERRIEATLDVPSKTIADLAPAVGSVLDGTVPTRIVQDANGIRGDLDLTRARIDLPMVAWNKGSGVAASLAFTVKQEEGRTRLDDIALSGEGFKARGSAELDGDGLRSARLSQLALNPGDDLAMTATRHGKGYGVEVSGAQFDARPILQHLRETLGKDDDGRARGPTFDVVVNVDRLNGFGGQSVQDFSLNYASSGGRMAALALDGRLSGRDMRADLSPRGDARAIGLSSDDVGALLGFAGLYGHMEGGRGALNLIGNPDQGYSGTLEVRDFALVDEPRLSRLVASAPAPGASSLSQALGQDLRTERATFDQAAAKLAFSGGTLRVADGIVRGPVFGSSFAGTLYDPRRTIDIAGSFMPAYGLNRVFGAIPVLGQILGNGNEGGLIGITYHLSGPFSSPTLVVNPISVIAPGIFRQIFAY